jgi:hypothetical protein
VKCWRERKDVWEFSICRAHLASFCSTTTLAKSVIQLPPLKVSSSWNLPMDERKYIFHVKVEILYFFLLNHYQSKFQSWLLIITKLQLVQPWSVNNGLRIHLILPVIQSVGFYFSDFAVIESCNSEFSSLYSG